MDFPEERLISTGSIYLIHNYGDNRDNHSIIGIYSNLTKAIQVSLEYVNWYINTNIEKWRIHSTSENPKIREKGLDRLRDVQEFLQKIGTDQIEYGMDIARIEIRKIPIDINWQQFYYDEEVASTGEPSPYTFRFEDFSN